MASVAYELTPLTTLKDRCHVVRWTLSAGDQGVPIEMSGRADRSIHFVGTGSASLQGSNNGTSFVVLTDPGGTPITVSADGIKQIMEGVRYMRPVCTSGTFDCFLFMKL